MLELVQSFANYLDKVLGIDVIVNSWIKINRLPLFLRDKYQFYDCRLLDRPFVLMVAKYEEGDTPVTIRKHVEKVLEIGGCEAIYVNRSVASFNRKRLVEQRVSFVIPDNQLYLPAMGMDLREHIRKPRRVIGKYFSPSSQAVVLHAIYLGVGRENKFSPKELSLVLNYAPMTLTRAFDEIESVGLGDVRMSGRERILQFPKNKRELWDKAKPYLRSPVKRSVAAGANELRDYPLAGFSALSRYTMLADPRRMVYALSLSQWKSISLKRLEEPLQLVDEDAVSIEIWAYNPFSAGLLECVDPLSLYLSIAELEDERVEAALEELLGRVSW